MDNCPFRIGGTSKNKKREQFALLPHLVKLCKILPLSFGKDFFYDEIKSQYFIILT